MGRPRLLRPRPQSDRRREGSRGARGFPSSEDELRALPGIGEYSAAAIAAIAFGRDCVVVDTNVARVIARLYALGLPSRRDIREKVAALTPSGQAGDFAQAMMDLGATICRPRAPGCPDCPLSADCLARASGMPEAYPAAKTKKARPQRHGVAQWIERDGAVWLVRRPPSGLLGGMAALPGNEWTEEPPQPLAAPLTKIRHVFTHFALDLAIVRADRPSGEGWWHPLDRLGEAGLPTLYRRASEQVLARSAPLEEAPIQP